VKPSDTDPGRGPAFALLVLGGIALFGNGLKSIVSSSVLMSETQFAGFLRIPVERTGLLMEGIIAGMVIALAVCPILLQRYSPRSLGIVASAIAAIAFASFGLVDIAAPGERQREVAVFVCLTLGAGALACLAPASQSSIAGAVIATAARGPVTTVWTGAAPAGFLVAPQLVKYVLPLLGLGGYFLAFSLLPMLVLVLFVGIVHLQSSVDTTRPAVAKLPTYVLASFVAVIAAFELWSTLGPLVGYLKPMTMASLALLALAIAMLVHSSCDDALPADALGNSAWLLAALFLLQLPTTGFFDTAYLFRYLSDEAFIADRSTLAAASQVSGTFLMGALAHRRPGHERRWLLIATVITLAGVLSICVYPWMGVNRAYFLWTPALQGFGTGALTALLVLAVMRDAVRHPILAALPSLAIMFGTEFGLEILELVFAAGKGAGQAIPAAYQTLFTAQALLALTVPIAVLIASRRELPASA